MTNIILCGGSVTRLWPISRKYYPKQFLITLNGKSLFQLTFERNQNLFNNHIIVTNKDYYFLVHDQLSEIPNSNYNNYKFILEPRGKNTAPAIALACLLVYPEEVVFVIPSDHLIYDYPKHEEVINLAKEWAERGYLIAFGITHTSP